MKKRHKLLLAGSAVLPMLGAGGLVASAATETVNPQDSLIQKIATRFNLNADEVKTVFDEARSERQAEMEVRAEERLAEAVSNGELTQEQSDLITAKRSELQEKRETDKETFQNLSSEDRRVKMREERESLQAWVEENAIDLKWLIGGRAHGHGGMGLRGESPLGSANKPE